MINRNKSLREVQNWKIFCEKNKAPNYGPIFSEYTFDG